MPRPHRGDWSVYAVLDQMLWQAPEEADRTLNVFVRAMGTPQTDRNLIDFSLNAGLTLHEPLLHRDIVAVVRYLDTLGLDDVAVTTNATRHGLPG